MKQYKQYKYLVSKNRKTSQKVGHRCVNAIFFIIFLRHGDIFVISWNTAVFFQHWSLNWLINTPSPRVADASKKD